MAPNNTCKKCSLVVDARVDLFVVCEGDYALPFHARCCNLNESDVLAINGNIIWLCNDCLARFRRVRDSKDGDEIGSRDGTVYNRESEESLEDQVRKLKDAVAEIRNSMVNVFPNGPRIDPSFLHFTPVSSSKLLDGTNACGIVMNNEESLRHECAMDDNNFSLLLSNIHTSVAESDIQRMVAQALDAANFVPEDLDVRKLIPQWKSRSSLDFLSFKVVLDKSWKAKAMCPSTWPKGVKFREFVRKRFDTWRPVI